VNFIDLHFQIEPSFHLTAAHVFLSMFAEVFDFEIWNPDLISYLELSVHFVEKRSTIKKSKIALAMYFAAAAASKETRIQVKDIEESLERCNLASYFHTDEIMTLFDELEQLQANRNTTRLKIPARHELFRGGGTSGLQAADKQANSLSINSSMTPVASCEPDLDSESSADSWINPYSSVSYS